METLTSYLVSLVLTPAVPATVMIGFYGVRRLIERCAK